MHLYIFDTFRGLASELRVEPEVTILSSSHPWENSVEFFDDAVFLLDGQNLDIAAAAFKEITTRAPAHRVAVFVDELDLALLSLVQGARIFFKSDGLEPVREDFAKDPGGKETSLFTMAGLKERAKVLIVDDERGICEVMRELFVDHFKSVTTASSLNEVESLAPVETFDLIITDCLMPGITRGVDLIEKIHRSFPKTPMIVLTGDERFVDFGKIFDLGVECVFIKPPKLQTFVEVAIEIALLHQGGDAELKRRVTHPLQAPVLVIGSDQAKTVWKLNTRTMGREALTIEGPAAGEFLHPGDEFDFQIHFGFKRYGVLTGRARCEGVYGENVHRAKILDAQSTPASGRAFLFNDLMTRNLKWDPTKDSIL
jgi:CheY-like chemotaxis protein